jgi:hypothetical protein
MDRNYEEDPLSPEAAGRPLFSSPPLTSDVVFGDALGFTWYF